MLGRLNFALGCFLTWAEWFLIQLEGTSFAKDVREGTGEVRSSRSCWDIGVGWEDVKAGKIIGNLGMEKEIGAEKYL